MNPPAPLNKRLFHSKETVDRYNADMAAYIAYQADIEYRHSKAKKNKHASRREQFNEQ